MNNNILIIGGGPGGYVAAIQAAHMGAEVTLIEKDRLGGTCLNRGCIPTKALLHSTEYLKAGEKAAQYGIDMSVNSFDLAKMAASKDSVVNQLVQGIEYLIKNNRIELIRGAASFVDRNTVEISCQGASVTKKAGNIIISTGSRPAVIKVPGWDSPKMMLSDDALSLNEVPERLAVIGGGAVGLELGYIYMNLGAEVTVVEMMPRLLPSMDEEIVDQLEMMLTFKGMKIMKSAQLKRITETGIEVSTGGGTLNVAADKVLMATGRTPYTEGLNLDRAGVATEKGRITVNSRMETSSSGIYAIGDVVGGIQLAHVASAEGMTAVANCRGKVTEMDYKVVPGCIYTLPEVAGVGLTEKQAVEQGYRVKTGKFGMSGCGKAVAVGQPEGMVKIVADEKYGEILGMHIIGSRATDLIAEGALAMKLEATAEELAATIHAHPTMSEAVCEAARDVFGMAIHK